MSTQFDSKVINAKDSLSNSDNQDWWENNPMTYDWDKSLGDVKLDKGYYDDIDNIFGEGHSLVNNPDWPNGKILENFIPYKLFYEKKVLEIGCGAGLVSSHIAKSGANLTAIDITENAINMTKKRFQLSGLNASIIRMNAEKMEFEDQTFDYVVTWGVIHHSGNMQSILDEIYRVLKPSGQAFIMVYNKNSLRYQIYVKFWLGIMMMKRLKTSVPEIAGSITDGFIARHLTKNEFKEMTSKFSEVKITFSDEKTTILKYLFGIGRVFKKLYFFTHRFEKFLAKRWGWYLEAVIKK